MSTDAPSQEGTAKSVSESYDAALQSLGISEPAESGEEGTGQTPEAQPAPPAPAGTEAKPQEADPEHIAWAKKIDGDFDPATGQFNVDRVIKRAYEINRLEQRNAELLAQYKQLLAHPEIASTVTRVVTGQKPEPPAKQEEPGEKTDEEILEEFVRERAEKIVKPVQERSDLLYQRYLNAEVNSTYEQLKSAFGNDEETGKPVYDTVRDQVGAQLAQQAQLIGTSVPQLIEMLVARGMLYPALESATRTILYPRLAERAKAQAAAQASAAVEEKKRVALPARGTPSEGVKEKPKDIRSVRDAFEEAERELAAKRAAR